MLKIAMVCPKCGKTACNESANGTGTIEQCDYYCPYCGWKIEEMYNAVETNDTVEDNDTLEDNDTVEYIEKNSIGSTIKGIGWIIIILGILVGLIIGSTFKLPADTVNRSLTQLNRSSWVFGIAIMISSFVSGILFVGFGEIIILLNDIKSNTNLK